MIYKLKQKKKRAAITEMRHGVNISAPFVGMKREEGAEYPFAKQVSPHLDTHLPTSLLHVRKDGPGIQALSDVPCDVQAARKT